MSVTGDAGSKTAPARLPRRHPRSARGAWTIVAIFAVGGLVLTGLYLSPRSHAPPAPKDAPFGVPDRPLCFVTCDVRGRPHTVESVIAQVRAVRPVARGQEAGGGIDYVLFVGIDADEVADLAAGLGMQGSYHPQLFQRAGPARGGERVGVCILSRQSLYEGARLGASDGPSAGVRAVSVVDGRKFLLACVNLPQDAPAASTAALVRWLADAGPAPAVVGGALGPSAIEEASRQGRLNDLTNRPPLLATRQWVGAAEGSAAIEQPGVCSWALVAPASSTPTSQSGP